MELIYIKVLLTWAGSLITGSFAGSSRNVTGDGDFDSLVNFLEAKGKLRILLSPMRMQCSTLLKKATPRITFLEEMRTKFEYIPEPE